MLGTLKAAVLESFGNLNVVDVEQPRLHGGLLLEVFAAGVCGTDPHIVDGSRPVPLPIVLGHEFYGRILAVANNCHVQSTKKSVAVGDLVAVVPGICCGSCPACLMFPAQAELCSARRTYGVTMDANRYPHLVGGYAEKAIILDGFTVHPIPRHWPLGLGALIEPFAVGVQAARAAATQLVSAAIRGPSVVVQGAGCIGLAVCLALRRRGINAMIIEPLEHRRALVTALGAKAVIDPSIFGADLADEVRARTEGLGPDLIVEAAGTLAALRDAILMVRRGGTIIEVGNFATSGTVDLEPSFVCRNCISIVGCALGPTDAYQEAEQLLDELATQAHAILTPWFALDDANAALENVREHKRGLKTLILPAAKG